MTRMKRYHEEALRNKPGQYKGNKQYRYHDAMLWKNDRRNQGKFDTTARELARLPKKEPNTMSTEKTVTLELTHDQALHIWHVLFMTPDESKQGYYNNLRPSLLNSKGSILPATDETTFSIFNHALEKVFKPFSRETPFTFESPTAPTTIGCQSLTYSPSGVTLNNNETVSTETLKAMIARCEDV